MIGEESGANCFSDLSCCEEKFYACERRYQCFEAAENLESMTYAAMKAGIPFRVFVEYRKERFGLSSLALKEMGAAHAGISQL